MGRSRAKDDLKEKNKPKRGGLVWKMHEILTMPCWVKMLELAALEILNNWTVSIEKWRHRMHIISSKFIARIICTGNSDYWTVCTESCSCSQCREHEFPYTYRYAILYWSANTNSIYMQIHTSIFGMPLSNNNIPPSNNNINTQNDNSLCSKTTKKLSCLKHNIVSDIHNIVSNIPK